MRRDAESDVPPAMVVLDRVPDRRRVRVGPGRASLGLLLGPADVLPALELDGGIVDEVTHSYAPAPAGLSRLDRLVVTRRPGTRPASRKTPRGRGLTSPSVKHGQVPSS